MKLSRNEFLWLSLGGALLPLTGCGDDSDDGDGAGGSGGTGTGGSGGTGTGGSGGTGTGGSGGTGTGGSGGGGGDCETVDASVDLVNSHVHDLTVPAADVAAGTEQTYTLEDSGTGHTHMVTLTAADFAELQSNGTVQVDSTDDGTPAHSHPVVVTCGG